MYLIHAIVEIPGPFVRCILHQKRRFQGSENSLFCFSVKTDSSLNSGLNLLAT